MRILFMAAAFSCLAACTFYEECPAGQAVHKGEQKCRPLRCGAGKVVDPASPHRCAAADDADSGIPQEDGGEENDASDAPCSEPQRWFADTDGDGLGDPNQAIEACTQPDGYVENSDDFYPHCARDLPPANCEPGTSACSVTTAGGRETCTEDPAFPGCTDWTSESSCETTAPVCSGAGVCGGCVQDSECSHLSGVCDFTGACVECTPATEDTACPDTDLTDDVKAPACDPISKTCSGRPRQSLSGCEICASDSECIVGHRCVTTSFGDVESKSYCLQIAPAGLCPNRVPSKRIAESVLGVVDTYCFPNTSITTCEAVLDFKLACDADAQCGAAGLADAQCFANACTYPCDSHRDCSGSNNCIGPIGAQYCNPN